MTDEQIYELAKDKALDIQKYIIDGNVNIDSFAKDCCIAGAHSRDEEIEQLKSDYHDMFLTLAHKVEQLRNPWISVEERLPDKRKDKNGFTDGISIHVLAKTKYGEYVTAWYSYHTKTWFMCMGEIAGEPVLPYKVTHWMPIQQIEKGGEK